MLCWSSVATIRRTYKSNCQVIKIPKILKRLRCRRNHLSKLEIMADNVLVGDNGVSEGEDGHLSLTLATPDLNLSQGWLIEMLFW